VNAAEKEGKRWRYGRMIRHGIALGVFFWLLESAADTIAFPNSGTLIDRIIRPTPAEFWMRLLATAVFTIFGIYAHETLAEHRQARQKTEKRAHELALFNWLNDTLDQEDFTQVLDDLSQASKHLFESRGATVYLLSEDGQHLLIKTHSLTPAMQTAIQNVIGIDIPQVSIPLRPGSEYLRILEAGEPQIINDSEVIQAMAAECTDSETLRKRVPQIIKLLGIQSVLEVPLVMEGQSIGLLDFSRRVPFSKWDLERAKVFAKQLTVIMRRRESKRTLVQLAAQLSLLSDIGGQIAAELDLQSVLDRAAQLVHERFGYHHVALFIVDRGQETLLMKARAGSFSDLFPPDHQLELGQGIVGWVGDHGETMLARDVDDAPHYVNLFPDLIPTKSELSVPVRMGNQVMGVLDIQSPDLDAFRKNDVLAMETLADQIAIAIKNARLYETAQQEIAERQRAEERLEHYAAELERSNKELQQFAYVASHDLQEPLRMVSSYVQLLERRYKDKLDDDAKDFIAFAVDGANRMQRLINALLAYSRIETRGKPFERTDCSAALSDALANLALTIEEANATITHDPLPTVMADEVQLIQTFQNLISNAIKFRRNDVVPQVHISAEEQDSQWLFSVRDNGIGIDPEHQDRAFAVFQRLHTREEYPGTGIGLAVCKRIIERHGGRIWVESEPDQGSTFYFTLPHRPEPTERIAPV
jgi:signal transduction histidine kinase